MTFKELYQYKDLKKEIAEQRKRLRELREDAVALSSNIGGLPKSSDAVDKLGNIVTEIAVLEEQINRDLTECLQKYKELEMYISNISDSFTRRIFRMRFVDGKSWNAIALICGGNQTADGVRKMCQRFLKK